MLIEKRQLMKENTCTSVDNGCMWFKGCFGVSQKKDGAGWQSWDWSTFCHTFSGQDCRKPTLFFFLWSSRESLISASSLCRSDTCFSLSSSLTDNTTAHNARQHTHRSQSRHKIIHHVSCNITHKVWNSGEGTTVQDCCWRTGKNSG